MESKIRIAGIVDDSIVDGPGIRYSVYFQGCSHHCVGCHNKQTWNFSGGKLVDIKKIVQDIKKNPLLSGVTFSGGDPFDSPNEAILLANEIKNRLPNLNIWMYTGYKYEQLAKPASDKDWKNSWQRHILLKMADVLVDGPYNQHKRDLTLLFRGSRNQRLINVPESLKAGKVVLWHDADMEEEAF